MLASYLLILCQVAAICHSASDQCEDGWAQFYSKCYKVFAKKLQYDEASNFCATRFDGNLLVVTSNEEQKFINEKVLSTSTSTEQHYIGAQRPISNRFIWADGSNMEFKNFDNGEPNGGPSGEDCVEMRPDKKWNDLSCRAALNIICETKSTKNCDSDWVKFGSKCYKFFTEPVTADEGQEFCREQYDADMVSIRSQAELDFLGGIAKEKGGYWFLGARRAVSRNFRWIDGTKFLFLNWAKNEPNGRNSGEHCITVYPRGPRRGKWNDLSCASQLPFVCQKTLDNFSVDQKDVDPIEDLKHWGTRPAKPTPGIDLKEIARVLAEREKNTGYAVKPPRYGK